MYPNLVPFQVVILTLSEVEWGKIPVFVFVLSADARYIYFDFSSKQRIVISTEAVHSLIVNSVAEKSASLLNISQHRADTQRKTPCQQGVSTRNLLVPRTRGVILPDAHAPRANGNHVCAP
jgi:hypothetical protein